jgi:hypothetical protein
LETLRSFIELSWLKKEGFTDIVSHEWNSVPHDNNPMVNWQKKFDIYDTFYVAGLRIKVVNIKLKNKD